MTQSVARRHQQDERLTLSISDEITEQKVPHVNEYWLQQTTKRNATSTRSLRRPRQGMELAETRRPRGSLEDDNVSASSFHVRGNVTIASVAEAVVKTWRDRGPSSTDGSSCSRPVLPLTACSFLLLSSLSDPAGAFQPANPPFAPRAALRDPQKQLRAYTPCYDHLSHGVLLQSSFTGRLGRQSRRLPYLWGQGWTSTPPPHGTLDVNSPGGLVGGDWNAGGSSGGSIRGRGVVRARSSAEASTGAREAHATAQAPTYGSFSRASASSTVEIFPDIMEALSCHKRVHGHVRIWPTFKVPSSTPWPENLWGMELGKLIYKLRNEKDVYKRQFPDRMTLLQNMGFEWEHSAVPEEWDLIVLGIEAFYRIKGHSRVPTRYVVPAEEPWPIEIWGHKLGSRVAQMRQTGRYLGDDEEMIAGRRAVLDKLGFEWRLRVHDSDVENGNPEEFSVLCEGLQVYRDLGGSVPDMPPTFVIPNADPWPLRTRGFPLGNQVRLVTSKRKYAKDSKESEEKLVALGVPMSEPEEGAQRRWNGPTETRFDKVCKALEMFVYLYGHTQVPVNFEVPRSEPWPVVTWGVKLGTSLTNIVSKATFIKGHPERQARLEALGFDTDPGGVRAFKERIASGMAPEDALAGSQASIGFKERQKQQSREDGDAMDSQALLGSVMNSLRTKESTRGGTAVALEDVGPAASSSPLSQPPKTLKDKDEIEESWSPKQQEPEQEQEQEQPRKLAWEQGSDKADVPSFMREEFTDEERAAMKDETDLRYWPEETQHAAARKMIPLLGHLARGSQEVAQVDGPVGTEMVTLPGVAKPDEWDYRTKNEEVGLGYAERQVDGYLDYDDEDDFVGGDTERGVIDRVKGRRLKKGWSTAASALDWCTEEDRKHILEVGFEWDEFDDGFRWEDVVKGLKLYKDLYDELPEDDFQRGFEFPGCAVQGGVNQIVTLKVSEGWRVPVDYEWPRELAGMKLGSFSRQMRVGDIWAKHDPSRREVLDELGFDWGDDSLYLDFQWPEVIVVFFSVLKLTGHLDLPAHYVIPEEDPWPLPIRGYPAGFCLNIIRAQKEVLMEHYPDRYEVLRGMGVMWSEPILVDWENEDEQVETGWRKWGYVKDDVEEDDIPVSPEFGLKESDPL